VAEAFFVLTCSGAALRHQQATDFLNANYFFDARRSGFLYAVGQVKLRWLVSISVSVLVQCASREFVAKRSGEKARCNALCEN
jgi:hypothetical protein